MKIQLPLEVWVDVFAPISRYHLAERLNEIGSQQFADIAMFFLHEYGQIELGQLSFGYDYGYQKMAEVEMPANIKDFQLIRIRANDKKIDCSLMTTFFTHLRPILSNVNLWCNQEYYDYYDEDQVLQFVNKLLPLIDSFNSIHFFDEQCFNLIHEQFEDKFFAAKVISFNYKIMKEKHEWNDQKFDDIVWRPKMAILRKWLLFIGNDANADDDAIIDNANGNDANVVDQQPRILYVDKIPLNLCNVEIEHISKEFMQSTKPTQFIACFLLSHKGEIVHHNNLDFQHHILTEEECRNFETIRHVNQTTNELLSAKCFIVGEDRGYYDGRSSVVFLHSHPIVADGGEEHEGNMLLINQMLEGMPMRSIEDKFVYSTNRHIDIYRGGFSLG